MKLSAAPAGATLLVDANILLYAAHGVSEEAGRFLLRCASGEVRGVITSVALAEFCHRRMLMEAAAAGLIGSNPARALARKPALVRKLSHYAEDVRDLADGGLAFEPVLREDFTIAVELQQRFALLTNDSLNLAVARRLAIPNLATADSQFDPVTGLTVFKPSDLSRAAL